SSVQQDFNIHYIIPRKRGIAAPGAKAPIPTTSTAFPRARPEGHSQPDASGERPSDQVRGNSGECEANRNSLAQIGFGKLIVGQLVEEVGHIVGATIAEVDIIAVLP